MNKIETNIVQGGCMNPTINGQTPSVDVLTLIVDKIKKSVGYLGHSESTQPGWDDTEVRPVEIVKNDEVVTKPETKESKSFLSLFGYLGHTETTTQPSWDSNDDSYSVRSDDSSTHSVSEEKTSAPEEKLEVYDSIDAALGQMG